MVTKEQFINGVLVYADKEIVPYLPTIGKWGLGSIVLLMRNKAECVIDNLQHNTLIKTLEIVDCNGLIDADLLSHVLIESANKYGKCEFTIPMIGRLTFSSADIEKMYNYIIGGI